MDKFWTVIFLAPQPIFKYNSEGNAVIFIYKLHEVKPDMKPTSNWRELVEPPPAVPPMISSSNELNSCFCPAVEGTDQFLRPYTVAALMPS